MNQPNQIPKLPTKPKKPAISTAPKPKKVGIEKIKVKKITSAKLIQLKNFLQRNQLAHTITTKDLKTKANHDKHLIEDLKELASTRHKNPSNPMTVTKFEKKYGTASS